MRMMQFPGPVTSAQARAGGGWAQHREMFFGVENSLSFRRPRNPDLPSLNPWCRHSLMKDSWDLIQSLIYAVPSRWLTAGANARLSNGRLCFALVDRFRAPTHSPPALGLFCQTFADSLSELSALIL